MIDYSSLLPYGREDGGAIIIEQSLCLTFRSDEPRGATLLRAECRYVGEDAPRISFELVAEGQSEPLYRSPTYLAGGKGEYLSKAWRIPPMPVAGMTLRVCLDLTAGTRIFVRAFSTEPDTGRRDARETLRHNAHLGFYGLAPDNTMAAFELAAASGFAHCIAVPKVTRDGVLVCIHDDTINKTAGDKNGNPPVEPVYVWDRTYAELSEWEYGSHKNEIYRGERMPRLSDFFDLCARSGMTPMFSTHPGLSLSQWREVRAMLEERGLLESFHIKSFNPEILRTAYSVFGGEIDGYTYDIDRGGWSPVRLHELDSIGFDLSRCRVGVELRFDEYTPEITAAIRERGFFAAAWSVKWRDVAEYDRLAALGVTEFTEDYHCSSDLDY